MKLVIQKYLEKIVFRLEGLCPARTLDSDLEAAGVPKNNSNGKLDFHACRTAYINLVLEDAATAKEVQDLARHATPQLTMNVYGRVREESLAQTVAKVAERVLSEEKYVPSMYRQAVGAESENATAIDNKQLVCLVRC